MSNSIQKVGEKFAGFLHSRNVDLVENEDGRLESLNSEGAITGLLREEFGHEVDFLEKDSNRAFGDLDVLIGGKIHAINVKMVSETTGTYNGGSAKVFNHVLYGAADISWGNLVKKINEEPPTKICCEYFYLIYYKRSKKKPQFASLTDISHESIVTNPSNPIQLKQNLLVVGRTEEEKVDFMLELLEEVLRKKAQPYLNLKKGRKNGRI
jgi:hypothetical protein